MADMRTQFDFSRDYYDAVKSLPKKYRLAALDAICAYSLYGKMPEELPLPAAAVFLSLMPDMDKERRLAAEGRRSQEYKAWRLAVFERDNYTCQLCGAHGVRLNAHHKKQYAYFHELRYDIDNGITLCVPCHHKVHGRAKHG